MDAAKDLPIERNRILNASFLLACLCLLDAVFTDYGLRVGHIQEANLLVSFMYEKSIVLYYTVKLGLPLLLLFIVTAGKTGVYLRIALTSALFLYVTVTCLHIFWLIAVAI